MMSNMKLHTPKYVNYHVLEKQLFVPWLFFMILLILTSVHDREITMLEWTCYDSLTNANAHFISELTLKRYFVNVIFKTGFNI